MKFLRIGLKCVAAAVLASVGAALLVLPGPGLPLLIGAVALLATEFGWAADLQQRILDRCRRVWRRATPP